MIQAMSDLYRQDGHEAPTDGQASVGAVGRSLGWM